MGSQAKGLVDEAAEPALQGEGFGGGGNTLFSWADLYLRLNRARVGSP
jgi:hypothetical protein